MLVARDFLRCAAGHDVSPFAAGPRPKIDEMVGRAHDVEVVFDDDECVSPIAKLGQRFEQPARVARVQADRRFVEDVSDADQTPAETTGDPSSLKLTPRERLRRPIECKIVEPDFAKVEQTAMNLGEEALGDEKGRAGGNFGFRTLVFSRGARPARCLAVSPSPYFLVCVQFGAGQTIRRHPALNILNYRRRPSSSLIGRRPPLLPLRRGGDAYRLLPTGDRLFGIGHRQREQLVNRNCGERDGAADRGEACAAAIGADPEGRHEIAVAGKHAHSLACGTGAVWAVEAEGARLDFREAQFAVGAGEAAAEEPVAPRRAIFVADDAASVSVPQRKFDRFEEPRSQPFLDDNAIDDDVDVVGLRFFQLGRSGGIDDGAIHAGADKAFAADLFEQLAMHPFLPADERRQNHRLAPGFEGENSLDNGLRRLLRQLAAAVRTMGHSRAGVQEPEEIVDAGGRRQRAARMHGRNALLDRQNGGQPLDFVDVGALHLIEVGARPGREGFEIPALPLGEKGVEGERAFTAAADAGDGNQRAAGNIDVDILQIVDPRPADADGIGRGVNGGWRGH
jgi:hypothetical protein